jgi:hypothetical protein
MQADIVIWVSKVHETLEKIPRESAKDLVEFTRTPLKSGGNMPVDKGNLRNSATVSFNEVPPADMEIDQDTMLPEATGKINSTIDTAKIGQNIRIGFRANYAEEMEQKYAFIRLAAQRWIQFVAAAATRLKV